MGQRYKYVNEEYRDAFKKAEKKFAEQKENEKNKKKGNK